MFKKSGQGPCRRSTAVQKVRISTGFHKCQIQVLFALVTVSLAGGVAVNSSNIKLHV